MNISISYYSSAGGRSVNEDTVFINEFKNGITAIVADGLGGHKYGKYASELAVKTVSSELFAERRKVEDIREAIYKANDAIVCQQKNSNMFTTIALVYIYKNTGIVAHVGDSRIYYFKENNIIYQSSDHSVSQMAVNVGEISKSEIRGHEDRNKLLRALGNEDKHEPTIKEYGVEVGDSFLLCSDGFWELIFEEEMIDCLKRAKNAGEWLKAMRNRIDNRLTHKSDNNTAITIMIESLEL